MGWGIQAGAEFGWNVVGDVLYAFTGGKDGGHPVTGLIFDVAGNLYGTSYWGGAYGNGVVFKLAPTSSGDGRKPCSTRLLAARTDPFRLVG